MTSDVEPAKKVLLPYLQRADELQKHEPLVAYYCRLYGMERGLKIPAKERTKTTNAILISLMNQLEKDKKSVQLSPDDNLYVEGFALSVFAKADKQDRAGRADLNTAKTFYAASIFIEILYQFGPLQPDIEQKQKYAVWKAADIRKALSEGRKPVPGPPGGDDEFLPSPGGSMDSAVINDALAGGAEERPFVRQTSNAGVEMGSPRLDGESRRTSSQAAPHPDHHNYYDSAADHGMPQQPPFDVSRSGHAQQPGYGAAYPGSYHPSRSAESPAASPSISASPHGSTSEMDIYNSQPHSSHYHDYTQAAPSGQPHSSHYHDYTQAAPSGHMYNNPPTAYTGNNGSPDVHYYQSQGHAPSTDVYPASSALYSAEYSSFAGSRDPSGLERTTSAPVPPAKVQTYQPTPEKVAEAQKAARFAVSALAFDDVPTAVTYLKQSLELLTSPSSG